MYNAFDGHQEIAEHFEKLKAFAAASNIPIVTAVQVGNPKGRLDRTDILPQLFIIDYIKIF